MFQQRRGGAPPQGLPRTQPLGAAAEDAAAWTPRGYVRFAALGDSVTYGLGDAYAGCRRGWARILADAIAENHDLSFCNTARPGATAADVRVRQLDGAVAHGPHLTSLIVGLNDTMRSTWNPEVLREDLDHIAGRLTEQGPCCSRSASTTTPVFSAFLRCWPARCALALRHSTTSTMSYMLASAGYV